MAGPRGFRRVLLGLDGSPHSRRVALLLARAPASARWPGHVRVTHLPLVAEDVVKESRMLLLVVK